MILDNPDVIPKKPDAQHEWVMERARALLTRGTPRKTIFTKLKMSEAQQDELLQWSRDNTSRRR